MDGRRFTIPINPGATGPAPRLRLANVFVTTGRPRAALDTLAGVEGKFAPAANLMRAEAHLLLNEPARALPHPLRVMRDIPGWTWILRGAVRGVDHATRS